MILTKQTNPDSVTMRGIVNITAGINSKNYEQKDADGQKKNNDPLNNARQFANKPASSIPTIFARVLFFNSALLNIDDINAKEPSTYSTAVSQWLDMLELVFRKGNRLKYIEWKIDEQINALKESGKRNVRHKQLAEALKEHADTYLPGVESVYLIFDENNRLMGGTSPYTFVYTAPNYKTNQPVRSLLQREEDFQDFVIRLYLMLKNAGATTDSEQFTGFREYMEEVLKKPSIREKYADQGSEEYDDNHFIERFDTIEIGSQDITIATLRNRQGQPILPLHLYMRKEGAIVTDFYMDSDVQPFNALKTPLALPVSDRKGYSTFTLHDNILWKTSFIVPQDESVSYDTKHDLPDNSGVSHTWLTEINFLEDKLVQLPYLVDTKKFYGALNVPTKTTAGASVSYLLPIKPVLMRYFTVDKIKEMVEFGMDGNMIKVTLKVPVRNLEGRSTGHVVYEKTYNPVQSLYPVSAAAGLVDVISVGISPFVRFADVCEGLRGKDKAPRDLPFPDSYTVLLQASSLAKNQDISLDFVTVGEGSLPETESEPTDRFTEQTGSLKRFARFYNVTKPFEGIQIQVRKDGFQVGGAMILPNWETKPCLGEKVYMYSIDFGTTNTHMAYISYTDGEGARNAGDEKSFKANEIKLQVQYLAAMPVQATNQNDTAIRLKNYLTYVYGSVNANMGKITLDDQARLFFPNFLEDEYAFPIRTVVTQAPGAVPDTAKIFDNASIGFFHSKEISENTSSKYNYNPNLKWNLEESVGAGSAKTTAKLFFVELMQMVRNHWLQQADADLNKKPKFIITSPLAMSNVMGMLNIWKEAYKTVFGVEPQKDSFQNVAESLAPAYKLISSGTIKSAGMLNVDIGGGTTDLQYYANYDGKIVSRYDSVRFAGDDLWGGGYENVKSDHTPADANVFTRFTDARLANANLQINKGETTEYGSVEYKGKEKINVLLRDLDEAFFAAMQQDTSKEEPAFKAIQLHYAALIYYIANWIKTDITGMAEKFPRKLNFTGFGSKYIPFLFGKDEFSNEKLTEYTKALFKAFGVDDVPDNFVVEFSDNPKDVTAEGAALYALKGINREDRPKQMWHLGYDGYAQGQRLTWADMGSPEYKEKAWKHFEDFVTKFQNVDTDLLAPLPTALAKRFLKHAEDSFNEMYTANKPKNDADGQGFIKDSIFFWMLKGSLFNLDQD